MNTLEILEKVRSDPVLDRRFLGVFAADKIPKIKKKPAALIINLDESSSPGSHWVAMYITKSKCEYFDSYGRKPIKIIQKEIKRNYIYNNICVQDLWSISCGQMCLYYLTWRCRGICFKEIIKSMTSDGFIEGFIDSL